MKTMWRKGSLMLFGVLFVLSLSIASFLTLVPAKPAAAAPAPFTGYYYNNMTLSGTPTLTRLDPAINFDWGTGSPAPGRIRADNFSVRWIKSTYISTGQYRFSVTADDGVRLYLDGNLIINKWKDQGAATYNSIKWITAGTHVIKMEYYEHTGLATAKLSWQLSPGNGGYVGVYFDNRTLSGVPTQMRIDPTINFAWGSGSPDSTIPADNFSARWIRNVSLPAGMYRFTATADDGIRVFVDGAPIIDHWIDQGATTYSRTIWLNQGMHSLVIEYYEHTGFATAKFSFQRISS